MPRAALLSMREWFRRFASSTANAAGSPWAFFAAVALIVVWAAFGPASRFSDTWQLVINTITTLGTWLMVFLIQNTQNRDARALHLKIDELIRVGEARNELMSLESKADDVVAAIEEGLKQVDEV